MSELLAVFVIATLGYLIGRITICGIDLGTAAVLLVALVFGHFGITTPPLVRDIGLVCFVTAAHGPGRRPDDRRAHQHARPGGRH